MSHPIQPRNLDVDFSQVPRHWIAKNAAATALSSGLNMLFPAGERFFVRSVKHFMDRITDPGLRAQIKGFFGQEGRHARAHDEFNQVLRTHYEIDEFLESYERITKWIEPRLSPELNLAITAAAEHFTAMLAEDTFSNNALDAADPAMRMLLAWHAAEELEHKSVAFDVLQQVDPRYRTRALGLVLATVMLGGFWFWGATVLLRQDGLNWRKARQMMRKLKVNGKSQPILGGVFLGGIRNYLRRDFHPNQVDNMSLAAAWFAARGMSLPEAA
jgi:uncharacterized protein